MELVANIWPIADRETGMVQRYLIKAYAMSASEQEINIVLTTLARSDYRTALAINIPDKYTVTGKHGAISGAVPLRLFQQEMSDIANDGLRKVEQSLVGLRNYGIDRDGCSQLQGIPSFPDNPYFVITTLLELPDGTLEPQL